MNHIHACMHIYIYVYIYIIPAEIWGYTPTMALLIEETMINQWI